MKPALILAERGEGNNRPKVEDFSTVKRWLKAAREEENESFYWLQCTLAMRRLFEESST